MTVDRSRLPVPGPDRPFHFPRIVRRALANGLGVARRPPSIGPDRVDGAARARRVGRGSRRRPAWCRCTSGLLDEGSRGQSALDIAERVARIGGDLDVEVGMDAVALGVTTLDRFFETWPRARPRDRDGAESCQRRLQSPPQPSARTADADEGSRGRDRERAFARVLFDSHPYGHLSLGSEPALTSMTVDAARAMHAALFTPAGSTLVIVGDRREEELLDLAAALFDPWRAAASTMMIDRAARDGARLAAAPALAVIRRRRGAVWSCASARCAPRSTPIYPQLLCSTPFSAASSSAGST